MARAPNLDREIDRIYAGPLTEFVSERNELAKRLRTAGDREAATRVKGLAKPSLTAWVVNRLHHVHADAVAELMAAGERIRGAHLSDPAALGVAVEAHRSALAELVELARETLEAAGHPAGKAQVRRITGTLEALAAIDPDSLGVTPGRLVRDLEPPGFGAFGAAFPAPAPTKGRSGARRAAPPPAKSRAGKRATDRSAPGRKAATGAKAKAGGARAGKAKGAKAEARKAEAEAERKKSAALKRRISAADAKRQRAAEKARESERALRAADKALKAAERGAERKRRHAKEAEREAARAEKDADLARAALRKARERDERARETLEARETELASLRQWLASS